MARAEALAHAKDKRWADALAAVERALKEAPDWPDSLFVRAGIRVRSVAEGTTPEALAAATPETDLSGPQGALKAALADLNRYLELAKEAPNRADVVKTLGELEAKLKALAEREQALRAAKTAGEGSFTLTGVLAQGPTPDADVGALTALQKAMEAEQKATPAEVAKAWRAVGEVGGQNPYRQAALDRAARIDALVRALEAESPKLRLVLDSAGFTAAQRTAYVNKLRERFGSLPAAARWMNAEMTPKCPDGMAGIPGGRIGTTDVEPFCLDKTEVTREQVNPGKFRRAGPRKPAVSPYIINGDMAVQHCERAGKRLPTEHEWIWAARSAGVIEGFPWGEGPAMGRACVGTGSPCDVGAHPRDQTAQGVLDMAGNVSELVLGHKVIGPHFRLDEGSFARAWPDKQGNLGLHSTAQNAGWGFRCVAAPLGAK